MMHDRAGARGDADAAAKTAPAPPALPLARPRRAWLKWLLIGIVVVYVGVLIVVPLGALLAGALAGGLGPAAAALAEPAVISAFGRTLLISLIVVLVHGACGTAVAWVLVRHRFRGRRVLNGLIDLPFAVSPVVAGYMLILLFGRRGALAPLVSALGIPVAFALPGMILATLFVTLPFMVRELMPVLAAFGTEQEQAAATIGASGWQTFWHVTFPALRWGFIYGITLTFARALGEFGAVLVIGGGVQGRTETATLYIFRALDDRQYIGAYSAALLLGAISLALVLGSDLLRGKER
ncbi:MAG TPA: sulfate ABC transporter permease subunit [Kouleothrix sp.]|uniref:sulfate ABC transporter permease subunit n=1 Tax=Kouleothrix sp. TaxID=2779161 RepID=UPI002BAADB5C|nr:sulfate ABC transporter permease subunit [Kouleothrix sp.]